MTVRSYNLTLKTDLNNAGAFKWDRLVLNDNRVLKQGHTLAVSNEQWTRLSESTRDKITVTVNEGNTVIPWTVNDDSFDVADLNDIEYVIAWPTLRDAVNQNLKMGSVIPGFDDDLFMVVLVMGGASKGAAVNWSVRADHKVSTSGTEGFIGIVIDNVASDPDGQVGIIQIAGVAPYALVEADIANGALLTPIGGILEETASNESSVATALDILVDPDVAAEVKLNPLTVTGNSKRRRNVFYPKLG